ncbi:MAG: SRPBCC family protein [Candidatus Acidiferrales bacterium]
MNTCTWGTVVVILLALTSLVPPAAAQSDAPAKPAPQSGAKPLEPLAHLVGGQWRGELKMLDGAVIRARHVFEWGLGQTILKSKTYGALGDRPEQLVYEGVFAWHPEKKAIAFREFSAFGGVIEGTITPEGNALSFSWADYSKNGVTEYRESLQFPDRDHYHSEAYKKTAEGWEKILDTAFAREPAPEPAVTERRLRKQVTVAAPLAEVWKAWTTTEGVKTFFGPEAKVEAAVGGPFEIYFGPSQPEGQRGSEGCKVHSVVPMKLLAFTWNAPPTIPTIRNSGVHTVVYIELDESGPDQTRVTMTHVGWGAGEDWDKAYQYFDRAWDAVLGNLRYRFAVGPVQWPGAFIRAEMPATK